MNLFSELTLKFERIDWAKNPELGLIDTILTTYPDLLKLLSADVTSGVKKSHFGRKDTPTVEQVVQVAIYKEYKGMTYRDLEYAQSDSAVFHLGTSGSQPLLKHTKTTFFPSGRTQSSTQTLKIYSLTHKFQRKNKITLL